MKFKYKIVFLRRANDTLIVVRSVTLKSVKEKIVDFKYSINFSNPSYLSKNIYIYFIDVDTGTQYQFSEINAELDPQVLKTIVETKVLKQMFSAVSEQRSIAASIMYIVMGALGGALLVYIIMQEKIQAILQSLGVLPVP